MFLPKALLLVLVTCISESFSQFYSESSPYFWGTYRPDLLYSYSTLGEASLSFGIIYHSNVDLDLSRIERCPKLENLPQHPQVRPCRSLPSDYEEEIRYEFDETNPDLSATYKIHDGVSYLQTVIEENSEILMNIKTLRMTGDVAHKRSASNNKPDLSWSSFISSQRSIKKSQRHSSNETHTTGLLNHSLYFYFACQDSPEEANPLQCLEVIPKADSPQNTIQIKVNGPTPGVFLIKGIKNSDNFELEVQVKQVKQLNSHTVRRQGNIRRILQEDLLGFKQPVDRSQGNVVFVRARLINTDKNIIRVDFQEELSTTVSAEELVRLMKVAQNAFLISLHGKLLSSYSNPPNLILEIASYALSNIIGNLFYIEVGGGSGNRVFGIASRRAKNDITPSLFEDGFTLRLLVEWDKLLAEEIMMQWVQHKSIISSHPSDMRNIMTQVGHDFTVGKMKRVSDIVPSIFLALPSLLTQERQTNKEFVKTKNSFLQFAEDLMFDLVMPDAPVLTESVHYFQESKEQVIKTSWDPVCQDKRRKGSPHDWFQKKNLTTTFSASVDYLAWTGFAVKQLASVEEDEIKKEEFLQILTSIQKQMMDKLLDANAGRIFSEAENNSLVDTLPLLLEVYTERDSEKTLLRIVRSLFTQFGIATSLEEQQDCNSCGQVSIIANYLTFRKMSKLVEERIEYRGIYDSLLENILKNFGETSRIADSYSAQDGKIRGSSMQVPSLAGFLLILNEKYS